MAERLGSPRARLFLALEPAEAARAALAAWRDAALAGRDDLRPVAPEALHVTLVFLGYLPEKDIERVARIAFEPLEAMATPRLAVTGIKPIPPRSPRLFAFDLSDEENRAAAVQAAASGALEAQRLYRPEKRPFWPHITLARVKRGRRAGPLEAPEPPPPEPFDAPGVTLYRSILRPQGALYEPQSRLRLR